MVSAPFDHFIKNGLIDLSYRGQLRLCVTIGCCKLTLGIGTASSTVWSPISSNRFLMRMDRSAT